MPGTVERAVCYITVVSLEEEGQQSIVTNTKTFILWSYIQSDMVGVLRKYPTLIGKQGLPRWLSSKESAHDAGDVGLIPTVPWRRRWQPTPVFFPGESHGRRNLAGCSP